MVEVSAILLHGNVAIFVSNFYFGAIPLPLPFPSPSRLATHLGREEFNRVIFLNQLRARKLMELHYPVHRNPVIVCISPHFCW